LFKLADSSGRFWFGLTTGRKRVIFEDHWMHMSIFYACRGDCLVSMPPITLHSIDVQIVPYPPDGRC
jgi:hypothetical protein